MAKRNYSFEKRQKELAKKKKKEEKRQRKLARKQETGESGQFEEEQGPNENSAMGSSGESSS